MGPRPYGREAAVDSMRRATAGLLCLASLSGCSGLLVDSYDYGTIEVEALSAEGDPVAGISLILYRNQEHLSYGVTNSQGRYTFASVPYGSVGVYAQLAPTYVSSGRRGWDVRDRIDVSDGGSVTVVFDGLLVAAELEPGAMLARHR